jgi:hypothetical protein
MATWTVPVVGSLTHQWMPMTLLEYFVAGCISLLSCCCNPGLFFFSFSKEKKNRTSSFGNAMRLCTA